MAIIRVLALLFIFLAARTPGAQAAEIPRSSADRIVAEHTEDISRSLEIGELVPLYENFLALRETSLTPQAYDCLLGQIYPKGSPEALQLLAGAWEDDPIFAVARAIHAQSMPVEQSEEAGEILERAYSLRPRNLRIARALVDWKFQSGQTGGLRSMGEDFARNGQTDEWKGLGRYILGRIAWDFDDYETAYQHFSQSTRAFPADADINAWRVRLAVATGRHREAAEAVQRASGQPEFRARLAVALAEALNQAALPELAPSGRAPSRPEIERRRALAEGYEISRAEIPFGTAWEAERLAIGADVAAGRYKGAWSRFERRAPEGLRLTAPSGPDDRFAALEKALNEAEDDISLGAIRALASAMENAGWGAEALLVSQSMVGAQMSASADNALWNRLHGHQDYLAKLSHQFGRLADGGAAFLPPAPASLGFVSPVQGAKRLVSGWSSPDPAVRYFRARGQYLLWQPSRWGEPAFRQMAIFREDRAYEVRDGKKRGVVDLVVGEDLIPPAGQTADRHGWADLKEGDHCHVSVRFDDVLNDIFIQQTDRGARARLELYITFPEPPGLEPPKRPDALTPDTLACIAQDLFEDKGIGACAFSRETLPTPEECSEFRDEALVALTEHIAKREAYGLAFQSKWSFGGEGAAATVYALANSPWPRMGLYYVYRQALAGNAPALGALKKIAKAAEARQFVKKGPRWLFQLHFLSDIQIRMVARDAAK